MEEYLEIPQDGIGDQGSHSSRIVARGRDDPSNTPDAMDNPDTERK